jgi:putative restriction endonuclease
MSEADEWVGRATRLRQWRHGGERAPHKPLLLLFAMGLLQRTGSSEVAFADAKSDLTRLLVEFGPPRLPKPGYPFHHLENDEGLWFIRTNEGLGSPGSGIGALLKSGATGSFTPEFAAALANPQIFVRVARAVLDANFPETIQMDILDAVGIDLDGPELAGINTSATQIKMRDPAFRRAVLLAYEYCCAVCGYDGQLVRETVGIEAAHIRWWAADGPDEVSNALALCSIHHKLLDRGAIGISSRYTVNVSQHFIGRSPAADTLVFAHVGKPLLAPQSGQPQPDLHHISWHNREVFRSPERAEVGN